MIKSVCLAGQWFEVTPHEAGFTAMGLFVETSLLGSKFQGGELLQRKSEMDMVELQGAAFPTMQNKQFCRGEGSFKLGVSIAEVVLVDCGGSTGRLAEVVLVDRAGLKRLGTPALNHLISAEMI